MEDTISNKCKECKWFDGRRCTEPERNRINKEKGWDYYRNFRRMSHEPACKRFEEKENNMDIEKTIKDCECKLYNVERTIDQLEEHLIEEPPIPEEANMPINRYGLGQILFLTFKIVGIRSEKDANGDDIVLYDVISAADQRIGFKVIENGNEHYIAATIPEDYLVECFKEG